jgi:hypothetical protein
MDIKSFFTKPKGEPSVSCGGGVNYQVEPTEKGMHPLPIGKPGCLNDLNFVITGVQRSLKKDEVEKLIKQYGGRVSWAVSIKTSYLLLGKDGGEHKIKAAAKYGPKIIDEKGLFDMISTSIALSDRVRVVGLVQASNHNDKTGIITAINQDTGRIRVKLDGGNMEIDVKPCNISNPCDSNQRVSENQTQAPRGEIDGNNVHKRVVRDIISDSDDDMPLSGTCHFKRKRAAALAAVLNDDLPTEGNSWKIMTTHVLKTICKQKQSSQHSNVSDTYKPNEQEAIELFDFALKNISDISCERVDEVLRNCGHFEISDDDQDDIGNTKIVFSDETEIKKWVVANCKITDIYSDAQIVQECRKIKDRKKEQLRIDMEIQTMKTKIAELETKRSQL